MLVLWRGTTHRVEMNGGYEARGLLHHRVCVCVFNMKVEEEEKEIKTNGTHSVLPSLGDSTGY